MTLHYTTLHFIPCSCFDSQCCNSNYNRPKNLTVMQGYFAIGNSSTVSLAEAKWDLETASATIDQTVTRLWRYHNSANANATVDESKKDVSLAISYLTHSKPIVIRYPNTSRHYQTLNDSIHLHLMVNGSCKDLEAGNEQQLYFVWSLHFEYEGFQLNISKAENKSKEEEEEGHNMKKAVGQADEEEAVASYLLHSPPSKDVVIELRFPRLVLVDGEAKDILESSLVFDVEPSSSSSSSSSSFQGGSFNVTWTFPCFESQLSFDADLFVSLEGRKGHQNKKDDDPWDKVMVIVTIVVSVPVGVCLTCAVILAALLCEYKARKRMNNNNNQYTLIEDDDEDADGDESEIEDKTIINEMEKVWT